MSRHELKPLDRTWKVFSVRFNSNTRCFERWSMKWSMDRPGMRIEVIRP